MTTPLQANVAAGSPKSHPDSPAAAPSFTETYKFNFANLNCVANGDICGIEALKIRAYPTFNLYKDGKLLEQFSQSTHELPELTRFVEKHLSQIKPDSRPKEPPVVPEKADETEAEKKKKADAKAADEPDTSNAVQPAVAKPKSPANPDGDSIPLDAETFQKLVLTTRDGWFIKFYAPWCTHCQAMAPAWAELGRQMRGELNIGEVNCEIEKRLCKDVRLRGYPTILYFQNGERVEYDGLRGLGDLVSYARKAVNSGVREVDQAQFDEMEKKGEVEVAFLYFYDQATTSEDFEALERLTLNLIGHAPLLKTKSYALARRFRVTTWPRLIVIRDGRPSYYTALSPRDLRDYKKVLQWMRSVWLPIVPELSAANSHEIMNGRTVVLGILSRNKPEAFATAKKELKAAALEYMDKMQNEETNRKQELRDQKQLRIEEAEDRNDERALRQAKNIKIILPARREVGFAWVDGVFWERWVRSTYGVNVEADGERIIINEQDVSRHTSPHSSSPPLTPCRQSPTGTKPSRASRSDRRARPSSRRCAPSLTRRARSRARARRRASRRCSSRRAWPPQTTPGSPAASWWRWWSPSPPMAAAACAPAAAATAAVASSRLARPVARAASSALVAAVNSTRFAFACCAVLERKGKEKWA